MNGVVILGLLKALLPTKRIAAWIVGLLSAVVALAVGVSNTELKTQYCSTTEVVQLPKLPDLAAPVVPVEVKK